MTAEMCSERVHLGDFALPNYCRDAYAECTLPKGHDGEHRMTYRDDWKVLVLTWRKVERPD